jgi:hypothetical protein
MDNQWKWIDLMAGVLGGLIGSTKGRTVPTAPTSLSAAPGVNVATISFTAPSSDGGSAITNYQYSFNNSTFTALSPVDTTSPVSITGLGENTAYTLYLRAVNANGVGDSSAGVSFTQYSKPQATNPFSMDGFIVYDNPTIFYVDITPQNSGVTVSSPTIQRSTTENFASVTSFAATPSSFSSGFSSTRVSASITFPTNSIYYWLRPTFTIAGETFIGNSNIRVTADY